MQKTAYVMRISDWSSDVCSSDLGVILLIILVALGIALFGGAWRRKFAGERMVIIGGILFPVVTLTVLLTYGLGLTAGLVGTEDADPVRILRSEEHTSELQPLMRISYVVFCLKNNISSTYTTQHTY